MEDQSSNTPHVLIFPLPFQGHITPMLHLAELLCLANLKVTFLNTAQNHQRLTQYTHTEARFARYSGFTFEVIPDGQPPQSSLGGEASLKDWLEEFVQGMAADVEPLLRRVMLGSAAHATAPTCLIVDGWLKFAYDIANETGVPVIAFRCPSACNIWAYFCSPQLIEAGQIPFKDEDMDKLVQNVPGMEKFLRYRDLPSFCRIKDVSACQDLQQLFAAERQQTQKAAISILNTFEDLEGPILTHIRSHCPRAYSIGPLHAHLNYRLSRSEETSQTTVKNNSSSLRQVDRSCISWLDRKADKSVLYVSFGSLTILNREQLREIWAGLVQSNKYFLWVVRPDLLAESDTETTATDELLEAETKERGCVVSWAPQEEVLAHKAVGGFLTHSGWNSTLESIVAGMPMLCWPYLADQQVNSRYVSEVWKIGLDMKDTCDRNIVAKMINVLMDEKKDEYQRFAAKMSDLAKRSIGEGGSSYCYLDRLIEDIKNMSNKEEQ